MGLQSLTRKEIIKDVIEKSGRVTVSELVRKFGVSEVTVRRYLKELEREKILVRTYGGAVRKEITVPPAFFFQEKAKLHIPEKQAIAKAALKLVQAGETVFLDTGTTTLEIARLLAETNHRLTVVTNSLPVATVLVPGPSLRVFLLGGFLRKELLDFTGPFFKEEIEKLTFNQAFLGVDGISGSAGLTTTDPETARFEEAVMERSRAVNIVADSSKIGKVSLISYGNMKTRKIPKRLITDSGANKGEIAKLRSIGFEVILAKP